MKTQQERILDKLSKRITLVPEFPVRYEMSYGIVWNGHFYGWFRGLKAGMYVGATDTIDVLQNLLRVVRDIDDADPKFVKGYNMANTAWREVIANNIQVFKERLDK